MSIFLRPAVRRGRGVNRGAAFLPLVACVMTLTGCTVGPRNFENTNDRLRREVMQLEERVEALNKQLELRLGEIRHLRARLDLPDDVDTPTLADVELGRYTGAVDEDDDGRDDALVAYVRTLDQEGRFLPVAAEATLAAAVINVNGDNGDPDVRVLERRRFDSRAFEDAFRTGLTGTHYTLRLPLPDDGEMPEEVTLRVEVSPVTTEATYADQKALRLQSND